MGRRRKVNKHLPQRMYLRRGAYYYVAAGVWHPLGRDYGEALRQWADLEGRRVPKGRTVAEALAYYIHAKTPELAAATITNYTLSARKLSEKFGHFRLEELRPEHVTQHLRASAAKVSANRDRALLSAAYGWVNGEGWLDTVGYNPARVRRNKESPRRRYVTDDELAALIAAASPQVAVMIEIAAITGIRRADLLRVRLADVQADGLHVTQGKTGAQQVFAWTPGLTAAIEAARALHPAIGSLWLFPARRAHGHPMSAQSLRGAWERAREAAGLPDVRWHDLRRKAGSDAEREDAPALLGHADSRVTARHYRAKPEKVRPIR